MCVCVSFKGCVCLAHNNQNNAPRFSHNEAKTTLVSRAMAPILVNVYCYTSSCDTPPNVSCPGLIPFPLPVTPSLSLSGIAYRNETKFSLQPSQTLVHINCLLSRPWGGGSARGRGGARQGIVCF